MFQFRWLGLLLILYSFLALQASLNTPLFEAPDEYYHFAVIEHLARTGTFPPKEHPTSHPWRQMTFHAPLYYLISAQLLRGVDTSDFASNYRLNTHARIGLPDSIANQNFIAHVDDAWQGTGLAVRIVRFLSIFLGAITILSAYWLVREVEFWLLVPSSDSVGAWYTMPPSTPLTTATPKNPVGAQYIAPPSLLPIFASLIILLNPQFLFLSGIVSNDNLVVALSTLILAHLIWLLNHTLTWKHLLAISLLLACASIAKASGMVLYPVVALALLWKVWREKTPLPQIALYAFIGITSWILVAGWWYWGNWQLFGNFTATPQIAEATGMRVGVIPDLIGELRGLYFSFWGLFGWFNIPMPIFFYQGTQLFILLSLIGFLWGIFKNRQQLSQRHWLISMILGVYIIVFLFSWWEFHQLVNAAQGRLWFPLLGIFALIMAYGLLQLPKLILIAYLIGMFLGSVLFPRLIISPVYQPSPQFPLDQANIPDDAIIFHFREPWVDESCLTLWTTPITWDGVSEITVRYWWRADCEVTGYWSVFIHVVDVEKESCLAGDESYILAQVDTMPDGGKTPTPAIQIGKVLADEIRIVPPQNLDLSRDWHLQTGLYDAAGTFIRAFVTSDMPLHEDVKIGKCAPETVQVRLK